MFNTTQAVAWWLRYSKDHREMQVTAEEWIEKYWRAWAKRGESYKTPSLFPSLFTFVSHFFNSKI